jgi:hypothetical protein
MLLVFVIIRITFAYTLNEQSVVNPILNLHTFCKVFQTKEKLANISEPILKKSENKFTVKNFKIDSNIWFPLSYNTGDIISVDCSIVFS